MVQASLNNRLARFTLYAENVRRVILDYAADNPSHPASQVITASAMVETRYLFPNLQEMEVYRVRSSSLQIVLKLVAPTLTHVSLNPRGSWGACGEGTYGWTPQEHSLCLAAILQRIGTANCRLRCFKLRDFPDVQTRYQYELTDVISVSDWIFALVPSLPSLMALTVHKASAFKPNEVANSARLAKLVHIETGCFTSLRSIDVSGSCQNALDLLSTIGGPLELVTLSHSTIHDISEIAQIVHTNLDVEMTPDLEVPILAKVAECVAQFSDSLEEFKLLGPYSQSGAHLPLPWEVFEPLLHCHKLVSLSICLQWWGDLFIQDEDITRLAHVLPQLRTLRIWTTVYPEEDASIERYLDLKPAPFSLSCHSAFATSCPNIQLISLTGFDATGNRFILPDVDPKPVSQQVVHLALRAAPLNWPPCVALYLQTLFPNAVLLPRYSALDAGYSENKPFVPAWDLVAALMRYHRAAVLVEQGKASAEDAFEKNDVPLRGGSRRMRIADMPPLV
ncbi:hypothetical protein CALCODRAFT_537480 [Calocera cornea HHB12733]|uniref:Uncharacterized protein n=1 Tax=Calocera cornea HHB12733 TaxID=1353952 RepID=A0A165K1A4_9BASI|nr:hypothetical protein CALCODRAFT_537480 [Calocera cornea HHB12733]